MGIQLDIGVDKKTDLAFALQIQKKTRLPLPPSTPIISVIPVSQSTLTFLHIIMGLESLPLRPFLAERGLCLPLCREGGGREGGGPHRARLPHRTLRCFAADHMPRGRALSLSGGRGTLRWAG